MSDQFNQWLPLRNLAVSNLPKNGEFSSVYAFRDSTTNEILKYGKTNNLRRRILGNYIGGVGGSTTQRIHSELFTNGWIEHIEISWIKTKGDVEAERMESEFRYAFRQSHGKLPSWDRQM